MILESRRPFRSSGEASACARPERFYLYAISKAFVENLHSQCGRTRFHTLTILLLRHKNTDDRTEHSARRAEVRWCCNTPLIAKTLIYESARKIHVIAIRETLQWNGEPTLRILVQEPDMMTRQQEEEDPGHQGADVASSVRYAGLNQSKWARVAQFTSTNRWEM